MGKYTIAPCAFLEEELPTVVKYVFSHISKKTWQSVGISFRRHEDTYANGEKGYYYTVLVDGEEINSLEFKKIVYEETFRKE